MKNNKLTTKTTFSAIAALFLTTNLLSNDTFEISTITVTSSLIETNEKDATYATEIYTKRDIEESKSKDIYGFLNSQTSLNIAPNAGNVFSQKIDMRGYGIGDGYQNIVVTVDGRRLNNIDMTTQLLSSIPLDSIEKIEITKGSGSVQYGDGANAGAINIVTNGKNDNYIKTYFGNNDTKNGVLSLGYDNDFMILNAYADYNSTDGSRDLSFGDKDKNKNENRKINLTFFPADFFEFRAQRSYSDMSVNYAGALTLDAYKEDPNQETDAGWDTEQEFSSYVTDLGFTFNFLENFSFDVDFSDENKVSRYPAFSSSTYYDYQSLNTKLNYNSDFLGLALGFDGFDGNRVTSYNSVSVDKNNRAFFLENKFYLNEDVTISIGARNEKVEYKLTDAGANDEDLSLNAFDFGLNYKFDDESSLFVNFNKSYQAPDLDRLFWYGSFVGFIEPSKANNYNLGFNNIQDNNKLKFSLFYTKLNNEIYFYSVDGTQKNTNIDKSYKFGLEFFDKYLISKNLYTSINYSYIVAKIEKEIENGVVYDNNDLPGVSNHNVTLNIGYEFKGFSGLLSHTYRSEAYAAEDFGNDFSQKQEAYNSTDLILSYEIKGLEVFGKVQNLFNEDNGLWINDDQIYPTNFETTYYAGVKYKF